MVVVMVVPITLRVPAMPVFIPPFVILTPAILPRFMQLVARILRLWTVPSMMLSSFVKPVVASLAGDVEVEEASEYLYQHGIPAYAYSTEIPVAVLGAKYRWARGAGLIPAV